MTLRSGWCLSNQHRECKRPECPCSCEGVENHISCATRNGVEPETPESLAQRRGKGGKSDDAVNPNTDTHPSPAESPDDAVIPITAPPPGDGEAGDGAGVQEST